MREFGKPGPNHWPKGVLLVGLLSLTAIAVGTNPGWGRMWALAFWLWLVLKLALLPPGPVARQLLWFLWPGTDARAFFAGRADPSLTLRDWMAGAVNVLVGIALLSLAGRGVLAPTMTAWVGMTGIAFGLHFGSFRLCSALFRQAGIEARPIMDLPLFAKSLSDFWGNRWNRGFNVPARRFLFRPLLRKRGIALATMVVFGVSGLLHELVISVPAAGGHGRPTIYFLIQGAGTLLERGIATPVGKRLFAIAVVLLPAGLLFHPPFIHNVMLPFIETLSGKELS